MACKVFQNAHKISYFMSQDGQKKTIIIVRSFQDRSSAKKTARFSCYSISSIRASAINRIAFWANKPRNWNKMEISEI